MDKKIKRAEMVEATEEAVKEANKTLPEVAGLKLIRIELEDGKNYGGVIWPFLWNSGTFGHFFPKDSKEAKDGGS